MKIHTLINDELNRIREDVDALNCEVKIDCITLFPISNEEYYQLNTKLSSNLLVDRMASGNLYYLNHPIGTTYGKLSFIKIRLFDKNFRNYRMSVDFTVDDYDGFKTKIDHPTVKKYDTFELIRFKTSKSIINIVSLSAGSEYSKKIIK